MSLREMRVTEVMTTEVVTFTPDENVQTAMQQLVDSGIDAGPVVDGSGTVIGMLSTGDLIVEEARVHFPTVVNFLVVNVTWPFDHKELDDSVSKALGATVGEVMTAEPVTIDIMASVEDAATTMHDNVISRVPVVDGEGHLVGLVARGDIVRAIVQDQRQGQPETQAEG
ncbi:MAG: CBS domain-containing protein [Acidimicrobiales bacterium]